MSPFPPPDENSRGFIVHSLPCWSFATFFKIYSSILIAVLLYITVGLTYLVWGGLGDVHLLVCVSVSVYAGACSHKVRGQRSRIFPQSLFTFETGFLTRPKAHNPARMAGQMNFKNMAIPVSLLNTLPPPHKDSTVTNANLRYRLKT